ncbi:unnamed protein product [Clonostachys rosea]|uniref:Arylsulfotransferase n=1 Tax=Bionectria ochroleuca TaxID=29856 RepID=A0ABY6U458_BIOOC|nr:unnamed protein product [Clonostachys rosea]
MGKRWTTVLGAAFGCWLGAGFANADVNPYTNVDAYSALADAAEGFPRQYFRSSDIVAPVFQVNFWDHNAVDDAPYIFLGSVYGHMHAGPMIIDARDLSLVYADQRYENTYTSEVQTINGTNYLTFWEGVHTRGHANGYCLLFDEHYHLKYNVSAQGLHGALADMHEMEVTDAGTVIFSTYFNIPYDLSPVGGPVEALLMDSGFQEVDVATNKVLFNWAASDHFSISDSLAAPDGRYGVGPDSGFDFFHINSIKKTSAGNYLISSRHLSMLALIDGVDGHPIWTLGGKRNQFTDLSGGRATSLGWQHDARFHNNESHITLFDNHGEYTGKCQNKCNTRGLHLEIDPTALTVKVVSEYYHPEQIDSGAMGGYQKLNNGNVLLAWGHTPGFVEYAEDGRTVMDVQRGKIGSSNVDDMFAYRVHKAHWTGRPKWPPNMAMDAPHGTAENATVYLSWNGATDIFKWSIFSSNNPLNISDYGNLHREAKRTGFETSIFLGSNSTSRFVGAAAVDKQGNVLGSSLVYDMQTGQPVLLKSSIDSVRPPQTKYYPKTLDSAGVIGGGVAAAVVVFGLYMFRRRKCLPRDPESARYKPLANVD